MIAVITLHLGDVKKKDLRNELDLEEVLRTVNDNKFFQIFENENDMNARQLADILGVFNLDTDFEYDAFRVLLRNTLDEIEIIGSKKDYGEFYHIIEKMCNKARLVSQGEDTDTPEEISESPASVAVPQPELVHTTPKKKKKKKKTKIAELKKEIRLLKAGISVYKDALSMPGPAYEKVKRT